MASSKEYYQPGDLVYQGKPFARVIRKNMWGEVCAACFKRKRQLSSCKGCNSMKYCNRKCQKRGWADHKYECPFLKDLPDHSQQILVQLLGNVIMKLKGKDWKSVTEKVLDNEVSFDDLSEPSDGIRFCTEEHLELLFKSIKDLLRIYIGEDNMPIDDELFKLFLKVINNYCERPRFAALFLGLTKFTVSCVRNCSSDTYDGFTIHATKLIRKGSEKLSISLNFLRTDNSEFCPSRLHNCSKRPEDCSDCSQPYGESPLTKVLDVDKSVDIITETEKILRLASLLKQVTYAGPAKVIDRIKLKFLLERQKGVLGDTNILRIRTLALKCLFIKGPAGEVRDELKELITWIEAACGKNSPELIDVYEELLNVSVLLLDFKTAEDAKKELERLPKLCYGEERPQMTETVVRTWFVPKDMTT